MPMTRCLVREARNFILSLVAIVTFIWGFIAWWVIALPTEIVSSGLWWQRIISLGLLLVAAAWLYYSFKYEDRMTNLLKDIVGEHYYQTDGVSFMPLVRMKENNQAELSVYYQNHYENPANVIVHLQPSEKSFVIHKDMRDVHLAFTADGGSFGVIHQPIAVPKEIQGQVIDVQLAAASHYPRTHGDQLRRHTGMRCGTLHIDWVGAAFRAGVHEVSGEVELDGPVTLHLAMPLGANTKPPEDNLWRLEKIADVS